MVFDNVDRVILLIQNAFMVDDWSIRRPVLSPNQNILDFKIAHRIGHEVPRDSEIFQALRASKVMKFLTRLEGNIRPRSAQLQLQEQPRLPQTYPGTPRARGRESLGDTVESLLYKTETSRIFVDLTLWSRADKLSSSGRKK